MQCSAVQKDCNPTSGPHTSSPLVQTARDAFPDALGPPGCPTIGRAGNYRDRRRWWDPYGCGLWTCWSVSALFVSDSIPCACGGKKKARRLLISTSRSLCLQRKEENTYTGRDDPFGSVAVGIDEWLRRRDQRKSGGEGGGDSQRFFDDRDLCATVPVGPR